METPLYDQRLSVYCSHGTVNSRRFKTVKSAVSDHVDHALSDLCVAEELRKRILGEIKDVLTFSGGYRFESTYNFHSSDRVVVYVNLFHQQLEDYISRTTGELRGFAEVFPQAGEVAAEEWRKSA
jgi:hypothetical protein